MSVSGHCCQKKVCRSTSAEMEMRGLQEDFEENEGLYTFKTAHGAFLQSAHICLCCSLTQLPGMKAFHVLTILSQGGVCSPLPGLSSNVHGGFSLHKCTHYILEH